MWSCLDLVGEKKSKPDRKERMRRMHPGRPMMPEMLMMEMMHGFDFEDAEFLFEEMPFMMRMGPMRRMGRGPAPKREFDEERNHETTEGGVIDPAIRTIPTPRLGRDWPPYNDCTGGESESCSFFPLHFCIDSFVGLLSRYPGIQSPYWHVCLSSYSCRHTRISLGVFKPGLFKSINFSLSEQFNFIVIYTNLLLLYCF